MTEFQNLILRFWSLEQRVPSPHCEDLIEAYVAYFKATKCRFDHSHNRVDILSTRLSLSRKSWPACPCAHFDHSVLFPAEWTFWPSDLFVHSVCIEFKERKVAPKRAQICPDLLHPHGYPPRTSKRHTARSWGYTRELADILPVRYVEAGAPRKYPLTIRRKKDRFGEVFPQKLIIYLRILDILSLNSHRKSKSTPPLKANLQIVYRNQCPSTNRTKKWQNTPLAMKGLHFVYRNHYPSSNRTKKRRFTTLEAKGLHFVYRIQHISHLIR